MKHRGKQILSEKIEQSEEHDFWTVEGLLSQGRLCLDVFLNESMYCNGIRVVVLARLEVDLSFKHTLA